MSLKIISATTEDGLIYKGILVEPAIPTKRLILHVHGMSGDIYSNPFYEAMYNKYPENGIAFLAVEQRGTHCITQFDSASGELKRLGNAYERFTDCIFDIQAWVDKAIELGFEEIWLQAHSLGPSKLAYYIHRKQPQNIAGLIWVSPTDMLGWVNSFSGFPSHAELLTQAEDLVKQGKGNNLLESSDGDVVLSAATYLDLFNKDAADAIFRYADPDFDWKEVRSIALPVLAITGTEDDGVVPVADAYAAMQTLEQQLINSSRKQTIVYEGARHDFDGFGDRIVEDVVKFIKN